MHSGRMRTRLAAAGVGLIVRGGIGKIAEPTICRKRPRAMRLEGSPPLHACVELGTRGVALAGRARRRRDCAAAAQRKCDEKPFAVQERDRPARRP